MKLIDISIPLDASLAAWPGDVAYHLELHRKLSEGASVNLSSVTMSVHTGTHADSPFHFVSGGVAIEALPLESFIGPAVVVDVAGRSVIREADVAHVDFKKTPRLLFKSGVWPRHDRFPSTIPLLDPALPEYLGKRGVQLIGVDVPSVDALDSKELPIHHALARAGIQILESLHLADAAPGEYELIAAPVKLVGSDGAPVRAVLRQA
jgi:arylformamidase